MSRNLNTTGAPVHAGDRRRIWARFTDAAGAYADPEAFSVTITEGGGAETALTKNDFTREAQGEYYRDHTFTQSGRSKVTATASGNIVEVEPGYIQVETA